MGFHPAAEPEKVAGELRAALQRVAPGPWTTGAVKEVARALVLWIVPTWRAGRGLSIEEARRVGYHFEAFLAGCRSSSWRRALPSGLVELIEAHGRLPPAASAG